MEAHFLEGNYIYTGYRHAGIELDDGESGSYDARLMAHGIGSPIRFNDVGVYGNIDIYRLERTTEDERGFNDVTRELIVFNGKKRCVHWFYMKDGDLIMSSGKTKSLGKIIDIRYDTHGYLIVDKSNDPLKYIINENGEFIEGIGGHASIRVLARDLIAAGMDNDERQFRLYHANGEPIDDYWYCAVDNQGIERSVIPMEYDSMCVVRWRDDEETFENLTINIKAYDK